MANLSISILDNFLSGGRVGSNFLSSVNATLNASTRIRSRVAWAVRYFCVARRLRRRSSRDKPTNSDGCRCAKFVDKLIDDRRRGVIGCTIGIFSQAKPKYVSRQMVVLSCGIISSMSYTIFMEGSESGEPARKEKRAKIHNSIYTSYGCRLFFVYSHVSINSIILFIARQIKTLTRFRDTTMPLGKYI